MRAETCRLFPSYALTYPRDKKPLEFPRLGVSFFEQQPDNCAKLLDCRQNQSPPVHAGGLFSTDATTAAASLPGLSAGFAGSAARSAGRTRRRGRLLFLFAHV